MEIQTGGNKKRTKQPFEEPYVLLEVMDSLPCAAFITTGKSLPALSPVGAGLFFFFFG
jgi:hypothetical protein